MPFNSITHEHRRLFTSSQILGGMTEPSILCYWTRGGIQKMPDDDRRCQREPTPHRTIIFCVRSATETKPTRVLGNKEAARTPCTRGHLEISRILCVRGVIMDKYESPAWITSMPTMCLCTGTLSDTDTHDLWLGKQCISLLPYTDRDNGSDQS